MKAALVTLVNPCVFTNEDMKRLNPGAVGLSRGDGCAAGGGVLTGEKCLCSDLLLTAWEGNSSPWSLLVITYLFVEFGFYPQFR